MTESNFGIPNKGKVNYVGTRINSNVRIESTYTGTVGAAVETINRSI